MGFFKKRKIYYFYNPNTLSYERAYVSTKDRIFSIVRHLSSGILVGGIVFLCFMFFVDSPMEALLRKENQLLETQYELLSLKLDNALDVLDDIQQRDNNLYRSIFQVDTIPESIRKAGFGGTNRYDYLEGVPSSDLIVRVSEKVDILRKQLYIQSNSIDELIAIGKDQEERYKCIPAIQPIFNDDLTRTASGYGMRIDPIYGDRRFHAGMDFSCPTGTDIFATGNGKVTFAGRKGEYGNCVIIDHGYETQTLYGHMSKIGVRVGQSIVRGQTIGEVGSTGKSTGPHLHYEVIVRGKHQNPGNYYFMDLTPEQYLQMLHIAENHGQVMD